MTPEEKSNTPPIAPPVASMNELVFRRDSGRLEQLRETTPSPSSAPVIEGRRNNRAGTIGLRGLQDLVGDRDQAILRSIAEHRLLLTGHIYELHFWNHASHASGIRACNRVLGRLRERRFIRRLDRAVGGHGGGSGSYVWALDVAGERLLRHLAPEPRGRQRPFEPSATFLAHTLAVADHRIEIEKAARAGQFELVAVETEPATWRQFPGELAQTVWLKPDLEVTTASEAWEHDWFIEVDLGTESGSALIRKCRVYLQYFRLGREQQERGAFPRVVWVLPDQRRVDLLRRLLSAEDVPDGLFTLATSQHLIEVLSGRTEQDHEGQAP